jgi:tetratricopeptide (TPR) repeat protein
MNSWIGSQLKGAFSGLARDRWPLLVLSLLVAAAAVAIYIPAFSLGYVAYDDAQYVYQNEVIRHPSSRVFDWAFFHYQASNYHPLTWLSHAADVALFGVDRPAGQHIVNVVFHAANSALAVLLTYLLLTWGARSRSFTQTHPSLTAFVPTMPCFSGAPLYLACALVGLGFALHPLHVESVAWIAERKDVLSGFFYLLTLILYIRFVRRLEEGRSIRLAYLLVNFVALLAFLAKPMAITLPVVMLILDWYPLRRFDSLGAWPGRKTVGWQLLEEGVPAARPGWARRCKTVGWRLLEKAPLWVMVAASAYLTYKAQNKALADLGGYPLSTRLITAIWAYAFYLWKFFVPTNLAPLYPLNFDIAMTDPDVIVSTIVLGVLLTVTILLWRRCPGFTAAVAIFIITLIPVIGIVKVGLQSAADRYMYLPSIPLLVVVAVGLAMLYDRLAALRRALIPRIAFAAAVAVVLAALGAATVGQIPVWESAYTLWDTCFRRTTNNPEATYQWANRLFEQSRWANGEDRWAAAAELYKKLLDWYGDERAYHRPEVVPQLAKVYIKMERYDLAKPYAQENLAAMTSEKERLQATDEHMALGVVALHEKDYTVAQEQLAMVVRKGANPEAVIAYYNLACAQAQAGHTDQALKTLATALEKGYARLGKDKAANLQRDPDLNNLRTSPKFRELLKKHDLPEK